MYMLNKKTSRRSVPIWISVFHGQPQEVTDYGTKRLVWFQRRPLLQIWPRWGRKKHSMRPTYINPVARFRSNISYCRILNPASRSCCAPMNTKRHATVDSDNISLFPKFSDVTLLGACFYFFLQVNAALPKLRTMYSPQIWSPTHVEHEGMSKSTERDENIWTHNSMKAANINL